VANPNVIGARDNNRVIPQQGPPLRVQTCRESGFSVTRLAQKDDGAVGPVMQSHGPGMKDEIALMRNDARDYLILEEMLYRFTGEALDKRAHSKRPARKVYADGRQPFETHYENIMLGDVTEHRQRSKSIFPKPYSVLWYVEICRFKPPKIHLLVWKQMFARRVDHIISSDRSKAQVIQLMV